MDRSPEVIRLQEEFASATLGLNAILNEQFLALVSGDLDQQRFESRLAEAHERRKRTMHALLLHVEQYGW